MSSVTIDNISIKDRTSSSGSNPSITDMLKKDTKEDIVNIRNFLLVKHVTENNDRELFLVGTCVQELTSLDMNAESIKLCDDKLLDMGTLSEDIETLSKRLFFDYRLNDLTADEDSGWIKTRRVEMNSGKAKKTFQVNAPLEVEVNYDCFPFKIVTASVMIELSSSAIRDQRRRPNLLLGKEYMATNVAIQPVQRLNEQKHVENTYNGTKEVLTESDYKKKMDKIKTYDFLTPFPEVTYQYDIKKKYCPKFKVAFYMVESGTSKFVQIVFPMLLIAILNTVQVLDKDFVENTNFLSNAATFALTAVFILPSIIGNSNIQDLYSMNNLYIISIFVGLALSSIPSEMMGTSVPAFTGMIIVWLSFIMPIIGCIGYFQRCRSIRRTSPKQIDRINSDAPKKVFGSDLTTVNEASEGLYRKNHFEKFIVVHG